jgi:hypothetical protein
MKTLLTLLLATLCAATGYGQTLKALSYNTTNGVVVYGGTNQLIFTNASVKVGSLIFNEDGIFYSATNGAGLDFQNTTFIDGGGNIVFDYSFNNTAQFHKPISFNNTTNGDTTRTNLNLGLPALTNTDVTNFRTAIGLGSANAVSFSTVAAQEIYDSVGNKVIDLENFILGVGTTAALEWATNQVQVNVPILFNGTNSASATRTNLSLGLPALTNTSNVTTMRALAGSTNTNQPFSGVLTVLDLGAFDDTVQVTISNGIIISIVP